MAERPDDICYFAPCGRRRRPFTQIVTGDQDLGDDLAGFKIPDEPLGSGVTEAAIECASDLRRNAKRAAVLVGDIDHFHLLAVGEP